MYRVQRSVFVSSALKSGLVRQAEIDEAMGNISPRSHQGSFSSFEIDDQQLASHLISRGLLTSYQAAQLSQGRSKLNLGPYLITDWLGQGGMGQVFKAVHSMMGREVAIKVLPQEKSTPQAIARFTHEIRAQAQLDHENLVRAFDAGHDGNVYFLVTEYVAGADLRRLLRSEGYLQTAQAAWIIMQAALALDHAHRRGLIHRDVKPGNILVTKDGVAKVSDLGLSGWIFSDSDDSQAGKLVGTADYLAPEQIIAPDRISPLSDIYSLGCTLYYAVTGKVPFPGGSTREKARRHCEETPWHPRRFNPTLTDEFVDIIAEMMDKEPERRITSAAQVAARLEPWVDDDLKVDFARLLASPWNAPPLPTSVAETVLEFEDEDQPSVADERSEFQPHQEAPSDNTQGPSQPTQSETPTPVSIRERPAETAKGPLLLEHTGAGRPPHPQTVTNAVLLALSIAIPLSMLAGGLLMLALLWAISLFFE